MTDKPNDESVEAIRKVLSAQEEVDLPDDLRPGDDDDSDDDDDPDGGGSDDGLDDGDPGPSPDDPGPSPSDGPEVEGPIDADQWGRATLEELRKGAEYPLNDYGNGKRFELYFGRDVIWIARVGWYCWTGKLWQKDEDGLAVRRKAQAIGLRIEQEAAAIELSGNQMILLNEEKPTRAELLKLRRSLAGLDDEEKEPILEEIEKLELKLALIDGLKRSLSSRRSRHRKFAVTSGNKGKIDALLNESGVALAHTLEELDARDYDLNTESGVLRFEIITGEGMSSTPSVTLIPHAREQLNTKIIPATYDPAARSELFDAFINRIQPGATMREFLQRWFGLCFTGETGEQKLAFFHGAGANGKSVLVDLLAQLAGNYATTAKIESLVGKNRRSAGDATPDLIPLMGARFVRSSEPEEGERLQEAKIKELTGGEPLLVRALNEDFVEVKPKFKITISGNHKPEVRGTDDGIWRRLLLVPFSVQIPDAEKDRKLGKKLWANPHRSAVLNWVIEGLLDYMQQGLKEPDEVLEATASFREESDPIAAFLIECSVVTAESLDFIRASDLREAFQFWQKAKGEGAWGDRTVANRMKQKAGVWRHPATGLLYVEAKRGDWGYRGIKLTDTFQIQFDKRARGRDGGSSSPPSDQDWRDRSGVPYDEDR